MIFKTEGTFHLGVNTLFFIPGDVGGTETYLREMLLAIVREYPDIPITLFTNIENDSVFRALFAGNSRITCSCLHFKAGCRPLRIVLEQILLPAVVMASNVTVLWSPGYTAPFWVKCPQVVTVHDLQYKNHPEDLSRLERMTLDALIKIACSRCRAVMAVSEFSRSEIIRFNFAPPEKVHTVTEGVDPSFGIPITGDSQLAELNSITALDRPYILCVAHTYPHKNVHLLVEAYARLQNQIPHNLVIVGKPRLGEPAVEEAVGHLPLKSRLYRLQSGVSFDMLRLLYQKADMFVLPSSYEGFGLPVLEAMMAGIPVVTVRRASLPEVGGTYALYADTPSVEELVEKILLCIGMEIAEKRKLSEQARQWAATFTWNDAACRAIKVFSSVVEKRKKI